MNFIYLVYFQEFYLFSFYVYLGFTYLFTVLNLYDVALKTLLSQKFDMKDLGVVKKILGIEIHKNRSSKELQLSHLTNHFKLSSNQCLKVYKEVANMVKVPYTSVVGA